MNKKFAVIGVGNMAKSIIDGITSTDIPVSAFYLFDKFPSACDLYKNRENFYIENNITSVVEKADCILLSVKPQNYNEVLSEIKKADAFSEKLYISIGAGITSESVSNELNGANVIRVLPNLPMTIGLGASVICVNKKVSAEDFSFVESVFASSGSTTLIDEKDMNAIIGVTSSSPAYVFKFINAIYMGAKAQGLNADELIDIICDVVIGSATLLKQSNDTPLELISKVASKGGTTEQALIKLDEGDFDQTIIQAMIACTKRANELGKQ